MHYFVTGHTGFKGSWLILLLKELGHEVSGYSLEPVAGGLFDLAGLESDLKHHFIGDIRDLASLRAALKISKPDFAIHMAAQPLVLRSYEDPIETFTTNVDGTRNFLEAISSLEESPVTLVVTTDKVYRDEGKDYYIESDPLGGYDPYSASKAMADILTQSWGSTKSRIRLGIARAGNVVGAFDTSENRLIPDLVRALSTDDVLRVRNPDSVRPWQHVLDCLNGYLMFTQHLKINDEPAVTALNFGPLPNDTRSVSNLLLLAQVLEPKLKLDFSPIPRIKKETAILCLDASEARRVLGWTPKYNYATSLRLSLIRNNRLNARELALSQIHEFLNS